MRPDPLVLVCYVCFTPAPNPPSSQSSKASSAYVVTSRYLLLHFSWTAKDITLLNHHAD